MAYAAVVSLAQILKQLLQNLPDKTQIKSLHDDVCSLQSSLEKIFPAPESNRSSANDLEVQIRNTIYEAQDTIESFISRLSETEETPGDQTTSTSILLQKIIAIVGPITKTAKEMADSVGHSREDLQTGSLLSENALSSKSATSSSESTKTVGQEKDLQTLTDQLTREAHQLEVVPITGTPGIGKTTLAKSIYEHSLIKNGFDARAWATVSSHNHVRDIFLKLLGSMEIMGRTKDVTGSMGKLGNKSLQESDEQLKSHLRKSLSKIRYLIVIDDMWDTSVWDKVRLHLPDSKNGSRIVLTTRIPEVADYAKDGSYCHMMQPLDLESSWTLLREEVFGGDPCPLDQLETTGRKIAGSCGGLPLLIKVVGGQLFQDKTVKYWESVAKDINAATTTSDKPHLEILSLSYNYLPARLKGCFLYMGAFPEDSDILVSKLIKLWVAEGFLAPPSEPAKLEQVAEQCLKHLIDRNLIFVRRISSDGQIKTCGMHDSLRDLAENESKKEKFFHTINRYFLELPEDTVSQRRLSVHKNILMCMEDVYYSTKSIKLARTLLYVGRHHHHPLPFCLTFELLRVLDALTVYFIKFPIEIVKLIHMRYLSLTFNGKLPPSVSKLQNLQTLIIRQHPKIIYTGLSILPAEIWNMPQLRHLLFTESDLPPIPFGAKNSVFLKNLQTLSNVNAACCTEEVLRNIPNLKKLGIWIEAPGAVNLSINVLEQLEALKFTVLNPIPGLKVDLPPKFRFPRTLRKLSLSGCGIPWENITVIGKLQCLEVLKLREFAFCGPQWYPEDDMEFPKLKYLLLESLDLERWGADIGDDDILFPSLECLIIRQCYDLEEIPSDIGKIEGLKLIELVDCSSLAVASAREIRDQHNSTTGEQHKDLKEGLQLRIYSSRE